MTIETQDDVIALEKVGRIVSMTLTRMLDAAEPGMTTRELDLLGGRWLQDQGARSAPRLAYADWGASPGTGLLDSVPAFP